MMSLSPKNTSDKPVFLDANVLLEIVLDRPNQATARTFLQAQQGELMISSLTAHLVIHFGKQRTSLETLQAFLSDYVVLPLEQADFDWAFEHIHGTDFEDALQIASALQSDCYSFATFDRGLHKKYSRTVQNLDIVLL